MVKRSVRIRKYQKDDRLRLPSVVEPREPITDDPVVWKHPAYTIVDENDNVIACGGVILKGTHGEVWLHLSERAAKNYRFTVCKYIAKYGALIMNHWNLRILTAYINPEFKKGIKLAERLGFEWAIKKDNSYILFVYRKY